MPPAVPSVLDLLREEDAIITAQLEIKRARRSLADYATAIEIPNVPAEALDEAGEGEEPDTAVFPVVKRKTLADHHRLICDSLQATIERRHRVKGEPLNLMLFLPPGSAKSTYADVVGVPWFMGQAQPGLGGVLLASHSSEIAARQGRRARQVVRSPQHRRIFPKASLSSDRGASDNWTLDNGAEYIAAGILSGITGNRCAFGILDDPMRGYEAANSQTQRDKIWDAYVNDFCSRLIPGAPQVMIMTRWHEDDPAGRILPEKWRGESGPMRGRDGRAWNVICLPAECDREDDPLGRAIGDTLWPEWFTPQHWAPFKLNRGIWSSLYQQKPAPADGTFFQRAWFDDARYDKAPQNVHAYITSDHARTDDGGDFTVLRVWGLDTKGDLYWLGGWRGRTTPDKWVQEAITLVRRFKPLCWFAENDTIWGSIEPFIRKAMRENGVACRLETLSTRGDKVAKAQSFQGLAAQGRVHLPRTTEADAAIGEYLAFPSGKHDDEVDVGSAMGRAIMDAHPAIIQTKPDTAQNLDPWGRPRPTATSDWRTA